MNSTETLLAGQTDRRSFLRNALGLGVGAAALAAAPRQARADDAATIKQDLAVLTLALNLEYLEAEYYTYAYTGKGIENFETGTSGTTPAGTTTIKDNPKVSFANDSIRQYAAEIAQDERNHVKAIRALFRAAGVTPPSKPNIDLKNSFNNLAMAAGIAASFDPFANEINFLVGAFIFEDVGVTAYRGGAPLITNPVYLGDAAGILAVEAFHAALVRVNILEKGGPAALSQIQKISDLRDELDRASNDDQGLGDLKGRKNFTNIAPTNSHAQVFSRPMRTVLNIVYGQKGASSGGFFPDGINT